MSPRQRLEIESGPQCQPSSARGSHPTRPLSYPVLSSLSKSSLGQSLIEVHEGTYWPAPCGHLLRRKFVAFTPELLTAASFLTAAYPTTVATSPQSTTRCQDSLTEQDAVQRSPDPDPDGGIQGGECTESRCRIDAETSRAREC